MGLFTSTTGRRQFRLRDIVRIGQRLRSRRDGSVVRVEQVHRADRMVELTAEDRRCHLHYRASFDALSSDYELLLDLRGAR